MDQHDETNQNLNLLFTSYSAEEKVKAIPISIKDECSVLDMLTRLDKFCSPNLVYISKMRCENCKKSINPATKCTETGMYHI